MGQEIYRRAVALVWNSLYVPAFREQQDISHRQLNYLTVPRHEEVVKLPIWHRVFRNHQARWAG